MASSSARRSGIAVAATLLVAWLVCLRPVSAAAKSSSSLAGTPAPGTKLGIPLAKKLAKVGKKTLINKNYGNGDNDQLGSAAADNYGYTSSTTSPSETERPALPSPASWTSPTRSSGCNARLHRR
jgi:hypothetical protein